MSLPTTYKGRGPFGEIAVFMNRIHAILNNIRGYGGIRVTLVGNQLSFYNEATGFPYGDTWPFGVSFSGNKVTIHNIAVQVGDATVKTLADTQVTISNDGDYVYFTCPWTTGAITVGVTSDADDFLVTGEHYADYIVRCTLSGGVASFKSPWGCAGHRQKHPGNFGQF